jgi:hypothetical protein
MIDIQPLEPARWFSAVRKLAQRCRQADANELESLLRHGYHLMQLAPVPFRQSLGVHTPESVFEALLENGELETAARALLGSSAFACCSRASANPVERIAPATELALVAEVGPEAALLLSWSHRLLALRALAIKRPIKNPDPIPRSAPFGQHLRLIERTASSASRADASRSLAAGQLPDATDD